MKPPQFEYVRPDTLEEAVHLLALHGFDAKVLAGGQSLVPMLNLRLARPTVLLDINRLPLDAVKRFDGVLEVGATVRQHRLIDEKGIGQALPVLSHAARLVAHPAIRNRGTVGGSLAHADPAAELALVAVLNGATMVASSSSGKRRIKAEEFFLGSFTTALNDNEMLTSVEFRAVEGATSFGFAEAAEREFDFAMAAVAVQMQWSSNVVSEARVAVAGAADVPIRLTAVEELVQGETATSGAKLVAEASALALEGVQPFEDIHASAEHRRSLIGELTSRVLRQGLRGGPR